MADILIPNMEMPKNCCYCGFVRLINDKACCFAVHDNHKDDDVIEYDVTEADLADTTDKMQKKPSWCPLNQVPEHGDLVQLDDALDCFSEDDVVARKALRKIPVVLERTR